MPDTANTAMQRHWNEVAGPRWVARAGLQEARNVEVAALLQHEAAPQPGERVLDIGCGTGATAIPFAQAVGPRGHVTGVDISEPMLEQCRKNVAAAGATNLSFVLADAQVHRFPADSFELLISRFGVMFFADPVAAFTNLHAGLRQGGRLCMAVWASLSENTHWKIPFEIAVRHLGEAKPVDPREPGPMAFRDPVYLKDILAKAGFADISVTPRAFHVRGAAAANEAEHAALFGPAWRLMEEKNAPEAERQAIIAEITTGFTPYVTADGLRLPGTVLIAKATRA
ncbi:MAG TPA: class I SAM-dependent methyltransferase [Stellaceae bacterium]|nr:class I SAM-dependent methyltransferase [Stellaceae bacterium]